MNTQVTAPASIAPDTYAGHWVRHGIPAGMRMGTFTAAQLAAHAAEGVMWASFGHLSDGREGFGRERYAADADGNLHVYDSAGRKVIIHPADRKLRILAR